METYAISGANLNVIENSLQSVATELNGVIQNVDSVNEQVNVVENKVSTLDNEIKGLVKEIRETTFITSARQNIMYNNEQIEKKYGYFDKVRRMSISLIDTVLNSSVDKNTLKNEREKVLLNNPNYWLANAYAAVISWMIDDKKRCDIEVNNALRKNSEKTKLFFTLVNIKFDRINPAMGWLTSYIENLNPMKLDNTFIQILELCVNDVFGYKGKKLLLDKITEWVNIISTNKKIEEIEVDKWTNYIIDHESRSMDTPYLNEYSSDSKAINDNLFITSSYKSILDEIDEDLSLENKHYDVDKMLYNLVNEYEDEEKQYQDDNLKNKLIIENNGNKTKAEEQYNMQKSIYEVKTNLVALLDNIVMFPERYDVSNDVKKIAVYFVRNTIKKSYENINSALISKDINISIDNFKFLIGKETNIEDINKEIDRYINTNYRINDKLFWILLLVINLVGVVSVFLVLSMQIMVVIIILLLIIGNITLFYKTYQEYKALQEEKEVESKNLKSVCDVIYAEIVDYRNTIKNNGMEYKKLQAYLDGIDVNSFISTNNDRKLDLGD